VIYIATPTYDGTVTMTYAQSLLRTFVACSLDGIEVLTDSKSGCCYVDFARNWLVDRFLRSKAESIMFIDSDMGWDAKAVVKLYRSSYGVVAGAYPMKQEGEQYPLELLGPEQDGFVEAMYLPTGFMLIKRGVFECLIENGNIPQYRDKHSNEMVRSFFQCIPDENGYTGEDVAFCNRWRKIGGRIWCYPDIDFEHQGAKAWTGNYGKYLMRDKVKLVEKMEKAA
jgi:hypothetical protein